MQREEWARSLSQQLGTWRQRATEALGMSASMGVAIGGAAATATGAAYALVQGVAQGVTATEVTRLRDTQQGHVPSMAPWHSTQPGLGVGDTGLGADRMGHTFPQSAPPDVSQLLNMLLLEQLQRSSKPATR